ncbi:MAG: hypothetical protein HRF40_13520 [Nitrososphaera sp.]|jgi:hypothetical protein
MNNRKRVILLVLIGVLLMSGSTHALLLDITDPNLKVDLGEATVFVEGTVEATSPTEAEIPLTIYYDGTPPVSIMGPMRFTILFDDSKLNYEDAVSQNWGGSFTRTHNILSGWDEVVLVFGGSGTIPTTPTVFAKLFFTAKCQLEGTVNDLLFNENCGNSHIVINEDYYCFTSDSWTTGSVTIADYEPVFDIAEVNAFLREDIVEVPVMAQTNFRMFLYHHKISYDRTKLQFVEFVHNPDLLPGGCLPNYCYPSDSITFLDVFIANNHDEYGQFIYYTPELTTPTLLYTLKFKVITALDNQTIPITFLNEGADCWPYNANSWMPYCDLLVDPIDFQNGSVSIPDYISAYKAVPAPGSMISQSGTNDIEFAIQLQNNAPVGICPGLTTPNAAIRVNFDFGSSWDYQSKPWESDDFHFSRQEYENGTVLSTFFQSYDASKSNWRDADTEYRDLFKTVIRYAGPGPTSYANRFVSLPFTVNFYDGLTYYPARVLDTSSQVSMTYGNGLSWISEPIEIKTGEFRVPSASNSSSYYVSHVFSIRNNFGLDSFSVVLNVSQNHVISSIVPAPDFIGLISTQYIDSRHYRIKSVSGFHINASGEEYIPVATITYRSVANCMKPRQITTPSSVTFTEPYMHDTNRLTQYTIQTGATVSSKCHSNEPPPPAEEQIAKAETELLPLNFRLHQNHPNPFNPETIISYDVPKSCRVKISVVNILGQLVSTLVDEYKTPGNYSVTWRGIDQTGTPVSSGIYLAIMQTGEFTGSIKMSLMK